MNITIRFRNPSDKLYVKDLKPITYVKELKGSYYKIINLDSYTTDDLISSIVTPIKDIVSQTMKLYLDLPIYDEDYFILGTIYLTDYGFRFEPKNNVSEETINKINDITSKLSGSMMDISMSLLSGMMNPFMGGQVEENKNDQKGDKKQKSKPKSMFDFGDMSSLQDMMGMGGNPLNDSSSIDEIVNYINNKTKAEIVKPKETLEDYVCDEILKEELEEIKDFFENEKTYYESGIKIPKGVLFKGAPGTGKTYAARCIAGDTDCYFMVCTASSLQGMYVGSGAENIKNIFKSAKLLAKKSNKGVIIFIDEIDSFGSRSNRYGNASGEEDRTLNQLLSEISGFEDNMGVMVLAATNYPDRLDDALMRSGRFSRQITIVYPNEEERHAMVEYYFNKIKLPVSGCDYDDITSLTEGLTPADIKEISNESGILAIRAKENVISLDHINEAINKVITKNIRHKDGKLDIKLVSAHECGHVLAEVLLNETYPIKVTSYSYGDAGGFTQSNFRLEGLLTKDKYINDVMILLAGRVAESIICGKVTNGASSDIARAKQILESYYKVYNFEEYEVKEIDQIVLNRLNSLYVETFNLLNKDENKAMLTLLTDKLFEERVLYSKDLKAILEK